MTVDHETMERLAEKEHERWSGQARTALYQMTTERRERWARLIEIPYSNLTEEMKELDRMQVREYLELIRESSKDDTLIDLLNGVLGRQCKKLRKANR